LPSSKKESKRSITPEPEFCFAESWEPAGYEVTHLFGSGSVSKAALKGVFEYRNQLTCEMILIVIGRKILFLSMVLLMIIACKSDVYFQAPPV